MKTSKAILGSLGAIGILVAAQLIATFLAIALSSLLQIPGAVCNFLAAVLYLGLAYWFLKLFIKKALKLSLEDLGIPKFRISPKWALTALVLPTVVTGIYFLFPGQLVRADMTEAEALSTIVTGICFVGIAAGFVEEMVFRGVVMHLLDLKWGKVTAVLVPSLLFGFVHILGMDFSPLSIALVLAAGTMVGIMFSLIAMTEGSVWNSGIIHAIWNIITTSGILSVSSQAEKFSVFTYVLETDNFILTGGEFGIESSLIAVVGYALVAFLAYRSLPKEKTPD